MKTLVMNILSYRTHCSKDSDGGNDDDSDDDGDNVGDDDGDHDDDDDMFARRSWLKRAMVIIQEETIGGLG